MPRNTHKQQTRSSIFLLAATFLFSFASSASADWQDQASDFDKRRLAAIAESRGKGLAEASDAAGSAVAIQSALGAGSHPASAAQVTGVWRCRTIKLGGMTPAVVYAWFDCRISSRDGQLVFEKTSGSQRTRGILYPDAAGLVYLGASSVAGEPPHRYSGNGAAAGAAATPDDQIGRLTAIGSDHLRLELPYPVQESTFDVIELKR